MRNHETVVMVDNKYAYRELNIFDGENKNGERIDVELSRINAEGSSIMNSWVKNGYIPKALPTWWSITVYVTDKDGNCYGRYNPQELPESHKINFNWVLEGTEENRIKILEEIERLAF